MDRRRLMTPPSDPHPITKLLPSPMRNALEQAHSRQSSKDTHSVTHSPLNSASSEGSGLLSADVYGFSEPANHRGYGRANLWLLPVHQALDKPWITGTSSQGHIHEPWSGEVTNTNTCKYSIKSLLLLLLLCVANMQRSAEKQMCHCGVAVARLLLFGEIVNC